MAALNVEALVNAMKTAGQNLGSELVGQLHTYAIPELRKIAVQIVAIGDHMADYTLAGAKALMNMQVNASIAVIVAMTTLTLLAVQTQIQGILNAVRDMVNTALGVALL